MAIANTIHQRNSRAQLRKLIGPDLVFVVLNLSKECLRKRILQRHGEVSEKLFNMYSEAAKSHEPAGANEENTFNLEITENDSRQDVLQKVLEIVNGI